MILEHVSWIFMQYPRELGQIWHYEILYCDISQHITYVILKPIYYYFKKTMMQSQFTLQWLAIWQHQTISKS